MADYYEQVEHAAAAVRGRVRDVPSVAIVLGSGLGGLVDALQDPVSMRYESLPYWPVSRTVGHEGRLVVGTLRGRTVAALSGRCHAYEGHSLQTVTFAVRVMGLLEVTVLVLTNAAGAINTAFTPGMFMVIDDHINLMGANPLEGPNDNRFGPRFPDMSQVYSGRLRGVAGRAAEAAGLTLVHGVYAALRGPSYETPAEIRYLRTIGADAVGMSTVPEAMVARHMGIEVLGLSCISNMAAGVLPQPLDHTAVVATTSQAASQLAVLLSEMIGLL
jgi:purine-nucleoside phosphorylase